MKQAANSAVRFGSYSTLQQFTLNTLKPASGKLSSSITFCTSRPHLSFKTMVGADHSDTTMPLDNIKTRMQAAGAESKYRNSFDCLMKVGELQHYSQRKVG
jgi:solute carrier family 25 citrate transporter 1